jgi:hypothetical protein
VRLIFITIWPHQSPDFNLQEKSLDGIKRKVPLLKAPKIVSIILNKMGGVK